MTPNMQNAKDTFYVTLSHATGGAEPGTDHAAAWCRTAPESSPRRPKPWSPMLPAGTSFVLRWSSLIADVNQPLVLGAHGVAKIVYTTGGTQAASGLDRGRALEENGC